MVAAYDDNRAVAHGGHGPTDGTQQPVGKAAAAPAAHNDHGSVPSRTHQGVLGLVKHRLGGDHEAGMSLPGTPGGGLEDVLGVHLGGRPAKLAGERGTFVPLPQGPEEHEERDFVQVGLVGRPVHSPQTGLGSVYSDHQRQIHDASPLDRDSSVMRHDGYGCGCMVQHGLGDGADVHADRVAPNAPPDDYQGRVVRHVDQMAGGAAGAGLLDDLDARVLLPPRQQHAGQVGRLPAGHPFVQ